MERVGCLRSQAGTGRRVYGHATLLRVSRSAMVNLIVPAGICSVAVPLNVPSSSDTDTLRSGAFCTNVVMLPFFVTVAIPVTVVAPLQKRYAPVELLPRNPTAGFESSCKQTLNTVTVKEQLAVLLEASVAVHETVVVPTTKQVPEGGTQLTVTPGQLSLAGTEKLSTVHIALPDGVLMLRPAGHVMVGACVSLTVTLKVQVGPTELVQVTVVAPTGKNDPDAGAHVMVAQPDPVGAV